MNYNDYQIIMMFVDSYIEKLLLKSTKNNVANCDIAKFDKRRDKNYYFYFLFRHNSLKWTL